MGVAQVARSPFVVLTSKEFPAKDIKELIAYAKANPRKMNFGSAGLGDSTQMATELFNDIFDIKMTAVPYKGISPAQLDLLAGRLDMIITTIASIKGNAADSLPKLAFTGAKREPDYPNIPTVIEATGIQYEVDVWWGLFAPSGIPVPILQKMNAEVNKIVTDTGFADFLKTVGASPAIGTPEAFQQLLVKDLERWRAIAKRAGVQ
jgi:tripartite-type tricarboxylate transporter receptor subunit TctC